MQFFQTKSALILGAIALAIGIGAGGIYASLQAGSALAQGGETELEGTIEVLPPAGVVGTWVVSGRPVIVTDQTEIDREGRTLAPGLRVEIEGIAQPDGSIVAEEIEVQDEADDDDGGPFASGDDDDGPSGGSVGESDDDDGGPSAPQSDDDDDGGPAPAPKPSGRSDDDDDD